jgi:hypothetical protein
MKNLTFSTDTHYCLNQSLDMLGQSLLKDKSLIAFYYNSRDENNYQNRSNYI